MNNVKRRNIEILEIIKDTFRVNTYGFIPFRVIGLIDVKLKSDNDTFIVTLPFYRSSGTNSGKVKGEWYPIIGIKENKGEFYEFSERLNNLSNKLLPGGASEGWLAKNLFFLKPSKKPADDYLHGYSYSKYGYRLKEIGQELKELYENQEFDMDYQLDAEKYNSIVHDKGPNKYSHIEISQSRIFDHLMRDLFIDLLV